jgi:hypothetical protein
VRSYLIAVVLISACGSSGSEAVPPAPIVAKPKSADAAIALDAAIAVDAPIATEDPPPLDTSPDYSTVLAVADPWKGPRTHYKTAVLLVAARPSWKTGEDDKPAARKFQPLVCAIEGVRATGKRCGEIMPPRATVRIPAGELVVERSKKAFFDKAGEHTYPAPFGPACCMYNTCTGNTVPYAIASGSKVTLDQRTTFAVWPADADIGLEVAGDGLVGVALADVPKLQPDQQVVQAFARGAHKFASVSWRYGGGIQWDVGAGWRVAGSAQPELWANDYGMDVYGDADLKPIYDFSCGNI